MPKDPFVDGIKIIEQIEQANEEAYFVGGCVRDLLLKRPIKDIDIATSAKPEKIQQIFKQVIPVGIEHGTVIVRYNHRSYEVTTFRVDGQYSDNRHPDEVQFINSIDEDLKRRDFTMNALAMDKDGEIIDLFSGRKDIKRRQIRTVGDGYERFMEDALRMVRAIRFASQLGFAIESETLQNIIALRENISHIAIERITNELTKLFAGDFVNQGINYLKQTKLDQYLPIFKEHPQILQRIPHLHEPLHSFAEVIALLHNLEPTVRVSAWAKAWKTSNRIEREAIFLTEALQNYQMHGLNEWLVYQLPEHLLEGFWRLVENIFPDKKFQRTQLVQLKQSLPIQAKTDLAINGSDIIALFPAIKQGPWIREMITSLEKKVVQQELPNDRKVLKEWILCNPPKINS